MCIRDRPSWDVDGHLPLLPHCVDFRTERRGASMSIQAQSPTTGEVLETFEETSPAELATILERADAAFSANGRCRHAENAESFLKPEPRKTDASQSYVRFD